jgi:4-diphosphocytidyl-2-C-methyl-D-erythritol kinase
MNYVKLIAPAKVNLVLAVGEKLPDGYHAVNTVLHALALHDTIEIRRSSLAGTGCGLTISVHTETTKGVEDLNLAPEENIVTTATTKLAEALGRKEDESIDISITKRIPHQAGLGGGSSDAAATLKGLAMLWEVDLQTPLLVQVAANLGADVPFFLFGGCAYFDGKGENFVHQLEPRKDFVTLIRPDGKGISTKEAYARFDESPTYATPKQLENLQTLSSASDIKPWNNLTNPALSLKPELQEVFTTLEKITENPILLCGSGSAVAVLCPHYDEACAISVEANKKGWYSRTTSFASVGAEELKY